MRASETEAPVVDLAQVRAVLEEYLEAGLTDGLPVFPVTEPYVEEFLAWTGREPHEVLFEVPHLNRRLTVQLAAANAAMAGCRPEYFPVVVAAWDAIALEPFPVKGIWQSTTGPAPMLVVNGPVRDRLGINYAGNIFGSGFRANATIGRAIRLAAINVFGLTPHRLDQATHATPAKYAACFGEHEELNPWEPLHVEHGYGAGDSTVAVATIRSVMHIEARHTHAPEQLALDLTRSIARTGALLNEHTHAVVVLGPEHANDVFHAAGWAKEDLRRFIYDHAVLTREELTAVGKEAVSLRSRWRVPGDHPDAVADQASAAGDPSRVHLLDGLQGVQIVVAGANNAGVSSVVEIFSSGPQERPVPLSISKVNEPSARQNV